MLKYSKSLPVLCLSLLLTSACAAPPSEGPAAANPAPPAVSQEQSKASNASPDSESLPLANASQASPINENLDAVTLSAHQVDEMGEVMVLMYHNIGSTEAEWVRTPENFLKDMKTLYDQGFRAISLEDYVQGNITTPMGYTPVVITFDDGNENNFFWAEKEGQKVPDPQSAVGLMEAFKAQHPDFNMTATFFLNSVAFKQTSEQKEKLKYLQEHGYSIGNHTLNHAKLRGLTAAQLQKEIGANQKTHSANTSSSMTSLALPFGAMPSKELYPYTYQGSYEGTSYDYQAVLLVGWDPYYSPYDKKFDSKEIHRVRASEMKTDGVGIYDYLNSYEKGSRKRFISDGDPNSISIPKKRQERVDPSKTKGKAIQELDPTVSPQK